MSFPVSKFDSSSTSFLRASLDGREGYPWHSLGTRDCLPSSKRSSTAGIPAYVFTEVARRSSYGHLGLMDSRVPKLRHRGGQCVTPAWWHWYAGRSSGTSSLAFRSAVMQELECELGWRNGPEVELYCDWWTCQLRECHFIVLIKIGWTIFSPCSLRNFVDTIPSLDNKSLANNVDIRTESYTLHDRLTHSASRTEATVLDDSWRNIKHTHQVEVWRTSKIVRFSQRQTQGHEAWERQKNVYFLTRLTFSLRSWGLLCNTRHPQSGERFVINTSSSRNSIPNY